MSFCICIDIYTYICICIYTYMYIFMCVSLPMYLSICLSVCLSVFLSVCLSSSLSDGSSIANFEGPRIRMGGVGGMPHGVSDCCTSVGVLPNDPLHQCDHHHHHEYIPPASYHVGLYFHAAEKWIASALVAAPLGTGRADSGFLGYIFLALGRGLRNLPLGS